MDKEMLARLLDESVEQRQETAEAFSQLLQERYGEMPLVLKVLQEQRSDLFNAQAFKVLSWGATLDGGTAEMVAISAAAALRCDPYIRVHMSRALARGATRQQILEVLAISAAIAESSTQEVAIREYLHLPEASPAEVPSREPARRRGRPRTYRDRVTFWEDVVQVFREKVPRATVSGSRNDRIRSVRLGRGQQARLEWAFRRGRGFCIQLVLNGLAAENQVRLQQLEEGRTALERETGTRLVFESGRGRQARVAAYYQGSSRLNEAMRDWAAGRMAQFHASFRARLQ